MASFVFFTKSSQLVIIIKIAEKSNRIIIIVKYYYEEQFEPACQEYKEISDLTWYLSSQAFQTRKCHILTKT